MFTVFIYGIISGQVFFICGKEFMQLHRGIFSTFSNSTLSFHLYVILGMLLLFPGQSCSSNPFTVFHEADHCMELLPLKSLLRYYLTVHVGSLRDSVHQTRA